MPAIPRATDRPWARNGFTELFKEEDVQLGWATVRKTVLLSFLVVPALLAILTFCSQQVLQQV